MIDQERITQKSRKICVDKNTCPQNKKQQKSELETQNPTNLQMT